MANFNLIPPTVHFSEVMYKHYLYVFNELYFIYPNRVSFTI